MNTRVAFLTNEWAFDKLSQIEVPAGSAYYRAYQPHLMTPGSFMGKPRFSLQHGFGVDHGSEGIFGFDTVLLKLLQGKQVARQITRARELGQRVVVDVDDYYPGLTPGHQAFPLVEGIAEGSVEGYEQVMMAADTITVTTPFLQEYYGQVHPDVQVIPNVVDLDDFRPRPVSDAKPVIGWYGLTSYRNGDLETLSAWLPDFLEQHDLMFHHSGWHEAMPSIDKIIGIPSKRVRIRPPAPPSRLWTLMDFDIGLVPLADIPFNHAKSYLKGIEMAASGVPFVAQALPEYVKLANEGIGRVAITPEDWRTNMELLLQPLERQIDARQNYDRTAARHTPAAVAGMWRAVLTVARG